MMPGKLRILVVSRSYPADSDLYRYPFVHRRVLGYQAAGHEVAVFRPSAESSGRYRFDGVDCMVGDGRRLDTLATAFQPDVVAVHGLGPAMWPVVEPITRSLPWAAWLHGSELPEFLRRKSLIDGIPRGPADEAAERCSDFWRELVALRFGPARLVFPSKTAVRYLTESVPAASERSAIIPNPIDDELFAFVPKLPEQRFRILFIRPFDSRCYANDVAVQVIRDLASEDRGGRFGFHVFGDGPLFEETVEPLQGLAAVSVQRRFLSQREIADQHKRSGIFLVPTRLDTQGVSRDEAMASGLVAVTTAIGPVTEFVDDQCAMVAPPDNPAAMTALIRSLAERPDLFARLSEAAARNARSNRSSKGVVGEDTALLRGMIEV